MSKFFISGIGTDVGKTLVAAIITEALAADYWKPIQSGDLNFSDTDKVRALVRNNQTKFHPEAYTLQTPASPHYAAELDGVSIDLQKIQLPFTTNTLIVEGAGGLLVPLNEKETLIDLIKRFNIPVILVSRNYLGSINHTMLSIEALQQRNIPIAGIVFNGEAKASTEDWILSATGLPCLARIPLSETVVDADFVSAQASLLQLELRKLLIL
jgi:dethiobiotin synthetase